MQPRPGGFPFLCPDNIFCAPDPLFCPSVCQSPPLNTDFSDRGVFFVDSFNAFLIGITSDGNVVTILLADIPDSGAQIGLVGIPTSATVCEIVAGTIDLGETLLDATGECRLEGNFTIFVIEDVSIIGVPIPLSIGECEEVIFFGARSENLTKTLKNTMLDKLQKMAERQTGKEKKGLILDLHQDIIEKITVQNPYSSQHLGQACPIFQLRIQNTFRNL